MFVIKYHSKGKRTKYFSKNKGLVSTLKSATAFGESFRKQFEDGCSGVMSLKTLDVSEIAEMMYENSFCKVSEIRW